MMRMKEEQKYEIIVEKENPDSPNISIEADVLTGVRVVINGYRLFNTLAQKETILVALNEKLSSLLQRHIEAQAGSESEAREGR